MTRGAMNLSIIKLTRLLDGNVAVCCQCLIHLGGMVGTKYAIPVRWQFYQWRLELGAWLGIAPHQRRQGIERRVH